MSTLARSPRSHTKHGAPARRAFHMVFAAFALAAASPAWALTADPTAQRKSPVEIEWRGQVHNPQSLPEGLGEGALSAIGAWAPWMEAQRYRGALSADERVLLLVPANSKVAKRLALVERTAAHFDSFLPLPVRRRPTEQGAAPETPDAEGAPPEEPGVDTWTYSWSDDGGPRESETAVVLELGDRADQAKVIRHLSREHPYLGSFAAETVSGFSLERPLVASWLANEPENEEWSADAELVHRTATLLFLRRFGQQPFWLQTGAAWHTEIALLDGVWCFPYRREFIFEVEHSGWPGMLAGMYAKRTKEPFRLAEVADWKRGTWNRDAALASWGLCAWLATEHPGVLSEVLEDLFEHRDRENRASLGDGAWKRIPGWEVPVADQAAILERHLGPDVFAAVTEAFRNARRGALSKTRAR